MAELNLNQNPYFNDYDEDKKFHQIVFNPSVAVQARELSQIQDILQDQIKRFGDFVIANGSKVTGGSTYTDFETFKYVKVEATFNGNTIDVSTWTNGTILTGTESGAKLELLDKTVSTTNDPDSLFGRYITGISETDGVQAINITNNGSGYTSAPSVSIETGPGTDATATAIVDIPSGKVIAINVDVSGDSYGATSITTGTVTTYDINATGDTIIIQGGGGWQNLIADDVVNVALYSNQNINTAYKVVSVTTTTNSNDTLTVADPNSRLVTVVGITPTEISFKKVPKVTFSGGGGSGAEALATFNTSNKFIHSEQITDGTASFNADVQGSATTPVGNSSYFSVDEGVYYIDGFFVKNDAKSLILEKYNNTPTWLVGFDVTQSIITTNEDSSLNDPSQGSFNFNAPGADRLKIDLDLVKKATTSQDLDDFIQLLRVTTGVIEQVKDVPILGEIEKTIARRTFDESGSYTVRPYTLSIKPHPTDSTKLRLGIEPGKSFVQGFEHENVSTVFIDIDRARDTQLVDDGNTIAQFGNYVKVSTSNADSELDGGLFNINTQETINLYNAIAAGGTQIGTARVKTIEYNSIDTWKVYLYDIKMSAGGVFTHVRSIGTSATDYMDIDVDTGLTKSILIPIDNSATNDEVTTQTPHGFSTGDFVTIADHSGSTPDINGADQQITVVNDVKFTIDGIDITIAGTGGTVQRTRAKLFDSDFNTMVFKIPNDIIKSTQDPGLATNYQFRELATGVSFTAGVASIVLSGTETFPGAGTTLSSTQEVTNFQIVPTSGTPPTSTALGDILVDADITSISINGPGTTATITTTGATTYTADIIYTVQTTAEPVRTKTLITNQKTTVNTPNTINLAYDSITKADIFELKAVYDSTTGNPPRFTIGTISGGPFTVGELVDQDVSGAVVEVIEAVASSHMDVIVISGTPNTTGLLTGRDSGATTTPSAFTDQTDIKSSYVLDNGQKDNFYDHGRIQLTGTAPTQTDIVIVYNYFTHSAGSGYFSVDSYSGVIDYDKIPSFTSPSTGETVKLSDVFDFRPRRNDAATTLSGAEPPVSNSNITADYSFYLPRIDKIYLDKDKNFGIVTGNSSLNPITPNDFPNSMTLYILTLNAFTFNEKDLENRFIDNKRFTMKDIGLLEKRITNMEYYTSLSLVESDTKNLLVTDADGNERFKNGILIDSFKGHSVGDVTNSDYKCSIDFGETELRSPFNSNNTILNHDSIDPDDANNTVTGKLITLPFTETPFITQLLASKAISVNPFNVSTWRGTVTLTPNTDVWFDRTSAPDVIVNLAGENDAWETLGSLASTTQWNDWEDTWVGRPRFVRTNILSRRVGQNLFNRRVEQSRSGIRTTVVPETITTELGDRVINNSVIPFIRAQNITVSVVGMKPNTRVYPFFDDIDISSFCTPSGGSAGDPIFTDSSGSISGLVFALPNSATTQFRTGSRLFRLIDNSTNTISTADTTAETNFTASGTLETVQNTIISTQVPVLRTDTVTEERRITRRTRRIFYYDPLAQTFLIDSVVFPNGVFISSIDLYFQAKPTTTSLPVTVEIRNTDNGFPAQRVVPFSVKTLQSSAVNTSADATVKTTFTFDSPVYLSPGEEYALAVLSNSNEYKVYVGELDQTVIGGTNKISEQPYSGSLFKSQNASTWTPVQTEDLMFQINRCDFDVSANGVAIFKNPSVSPTSIADTMHIQSGTIEFNSANIDWAYKATTNGGSLDSTFNNTTINKNFLLPVQKEVNTTVGSFVLRATMSSDSKHISPVIDTSRLALITVEEVINNTSTVSTITPVTTGTVTTIDYNEGGAGVQDSIDINGGGLWSTSLIRGSELTISGSTNDNGTFTVESGAGTATLTLALDEDLSGDLAQTPPTFTASRDTEISSGGNAVSRYISRPVVLTDGFDAKDLKVFLTLNNQNGGSVKVYYRILSNNDPDIFEDKDWVLMNQTTSASTISEDSNDFKEFEFDPPSSPVTYSVGTSLYNDFKTFAIKIIMQGSTTYPPRIKDLRAIALAT